MRKILLQAIDEKNKTDEDKKMDIDEEDKKLIENNIYHTNYATFNNVI